MLLLACSWILALGIWTRAPKIFCRSHGGWGTLSGLSCCFLALDAERLIGGTFWVDGVSPSSLHCNCAPIVASFGTAGTWQSEGVNRTLFTRRRENVMTRYKRMEGYPATSIMTACALVISCRLPHMSLCIPHKHSFLFLLIATTC